MAAAAATDWLCLVALHSGDGAENGACREHLSAVCGVVGKDLPARGIFSLFGFILDLKIHPIDLRNSKPEETIAVELPQIL